MYYVVRRLRVESGLLDCHWHCQSRSWCRWRFQVPSHCSLPVIRVCVCVKINFKLWVIELPTSELVARVLVTLRGNLKRLKTAPTDAILSTDTPARQLLPSSSRHCSISACLSDIPHSRVQAGSLATTANPRQAVTNTKQCTSHTDSSRAPREFFHHGRPPQLQ